jgi:hypothetical protein
MKPPTVWYEMWSEREADGREEHILPDITFVVPDP